MNIEDYFIHNNINGPRSYYDFETFILKLLKSHINRQNKHFEESINQRDFGDAFSNTGFDNIEGATLIEIKFDINKRDLVRQTIERFQMSFLNNCNIFRNLLIITARPINKNMLNYISTIQNEYSSLYNIILWGPEEISNIIALNEARSTELLNNIFELRIENAIKKQDIDWKIERDLIVNEISESYKKGQFCMFLGAGVSSSAGVPDWNTLLNSLFANYLTNAFDEHRSISDSDINQIVNRLNEVDSQSTLMAARYIRKGLSEKDSKNSSFNTEVSSHLYKLRDKSKSLDSELIKSITTLCIPRRTGARVRSIITYNFDDLLERQLSKTHIIHKSVYCDIDQTDPEQLPIYHVHGFLPENMCDYSNMDKSTFVFSEEGYHKIYSDPYHWSNLVQLNSLRENTCLMIGLSMTDPNLRRLLDISARNIEKPRHYAFLKRIKLDDFLYKKKSDTEVELALNNVEGAEQFLNNHFKLNQEIFKELGVSIIWYEEYSEIPVILSKLASGEV